MDPGVPSNGRRSSSDFGHEKTVIFQCNPKYSLVGNKSIRCQDGVWNGHLPQCKGSNQVKIALHYTVRSKEKFLKSLLSLESSSSPRKHYVFANVGRVALFFEQT